MLWFNRTHLILCTVLCLLTIKFLCLLWKNLITALQQMYLAYLRKSPWIFFIYFFKIFFSLLGVSTVPLLSTYSVLLGRTKQKELSHIWEIIFDKCITNNSSLNVRLTNSPFKMGIWNFWDKLENWLVAFHKWIPKSVITLNIKFFPLKRRHSW